MSEEKILLPIRVAGETRRQLKIHAAAHDTSMQALIARAVEEILNGKPAAQREPEAA
jgi:hypothetical protein